MVVGGRHISTRRASLLIRAVAGMAIFPDGGQIVEKRAN